ncbi:hypothetical protein HDU93_002667, partial [Gonapodya sp. JEL0774]
TAMEQRESHAETESLSLGGRGIGRGRGTARGSARGRGNFARGAHQASNEALYSAQQSAPFPVPTRGARGGVPGIRAQARGSHTPYRFYHPSHNPDAVSQVGQGQGPRPDEPDVVEARPQSAPAGSTVDSGIPHAVFVPRGRGRGRGRDRAASASARGLRGGLGGAAQGPAPSHPARLDDHQQEEEPVVDFADFQAAYSHTHTNTGIDTQVRPLTAPASAHALPSVVGGVAGPGFGRPGRGRGGRGGRGSRPRGWPDDSLSQSPALGARQWSGTGTVIGTGAETSAPSGLAFANHPASLAHRLDSSFGPSRGRDRCRARGTVSLRGRGAAVPPPAPEQVQPHSDGPRDGTSSAISRADGAAGRGGGGGEVAQRSRGRGRARGRGTAGPLAPTRVAETLADPWSDLPQMQPLAQPQPGGRLGRGGGLRARASRGSAARGREHQQQREVETPEVVWGSGDDEGWEDVDEGGEGGSAKTGEKNKGRRGANQSATANGAAAPTTPAVPTPRPVHAPAKPAAPQHPAPHHARSSPSDPDLAPTSPVVRGRGGRSRPRAASRGGTGVGLAHGRGGGGGSAVEASSNGDTGFVTGIARPPSAPVGRGRGGGRGGRVRGIGRGAAELNVDVDEGLARLGMGVSVSDSSVMHDGPHRSDQAGAGEGESRYPESAPPTRAGPERGGRGDGFPAHGAIAGRGRGRGRANDDVGERGVHADVRAAVAHPLASAPDRPQSAPFSNTEADVSPSARRRGGGGRSQRGRGGFGVGSAGTAGGRPELFERHLSTAEVDAGVADGTIVLGVVRINKKNRAEAYVTITVETQGDGGGHLAGEGRSEQVLEDTDVLISGVRKRNRALEGDLVAVKFLDGTELESEQGFRKKDKERRNKE